VATIPVEAPGAARLDDTIESVILRRGSTRRFRPMPIPAEGLTWALAVAARPVSADFVPPDGTLLEHLLVVHDVEGVASGAYRWRQGELLPGRPGRFRRQAAHLCLEQELGGSGAYTVFHCATLEPVLSLLGARGYRAAQLEAGIAAGRLQLAAFALGLGATGLTFYDDEVSRFFATDATPMLVTAVGVPAYRSRSGTRPSSRESGQRC
jgi:nitroreductase